MMSKKKRTNARPAKPVQSAPAATETPAAQPEAPVRTEPVREHPFEAFARIVISVLALCFMGLLALSSLLHTTGIEIVAEGEDYDTVVNRLRVQVESVIYYNDNLILNIIFLAVSLLLCFAVLPRLKKIPLRAELFFIGAWTILLGTIWVWSSQTAPSEDSFRVTNAALLFAQDNFEQLGTEKYYSNYSFQLGYVLFNEILIRIALLFGPVKDLLFLQVYNVIFLALTYIGIVLINDRIFEDKRVRHLTVVLLAVSAQPLIFSVFLYGIIPGLMFAVYALYFELLYLQKNSIPCGILSILCISIAVMIKSNYMIALVALLAVAFVKLFSRKKFLQDIVYLALAAVLALNISGAVVSSYEKRSNIPIGEAVPYVSWFAMGLSESHLAPGWYNYNTTVRNFENNNYDPEAASASSMELIKTRLAYFRENPQYTNDFFYRKFVSQWNETSYQSIWNNKVRHQYGEKNAFANWICNDAETTVKGYMDLYAQLIFVAVTIGVAACLKKRNFLATLFPLVILGGMMYHMIAEAKSQYAIPYFILMMGFAAYGLCLAYDQFAKRFADNPRLAKLFCFEAR